MAEKRTKVTKDDVEILGSDLVEDDAAEDDEPPEAFSPEFECPDGHIITVTDSLVDDPHLAMTLLKGVALPMIWGIYRRGRPTIWPSFASSLPR